jgi:hypothetical protein
MYEPYALKLWGLPGDRIDAEQAQQQALSAQQAGLAEFNRALHACMQGRGYSVS